MPRTAHCSGWIGSLGTCPLPQRRGRSVAASQLPSVDDSLVVVLDPTRRIVAATGRCLCRPTLSVLVVLRDFDDCANPRCWRGLGNIIHVDLLEVALLLAEDAAVLKKLLHGLALVHMDVVDADRHSVAFLKTPPPASQPGTCQLSSSSARALPRSLTSAFSYSPFTRTARTSRRSSEGVASPSCAAVRAAKQSLAFAICVSIFSG